MAEPVCLIQPAETTEPEPEEVIISTVQPYKSKFKCDPCPCTTLGCGAKAVAVFTIVVDVLVIVGFVLPLFIGSRRESVRDDAYLIVDVGIIKLRTIQISHKLDIFIIQLLMALASSILAIFLCIGARQMKRWLCGVYLAGTCILEFVGVILIIFAIWNGKFLRPRVRFRVSDVILDQLPELCLLCITAYFLIVVYYFMKEIKLKMPKFQHSHVPDQHFQEGIVRPLPYQIGVLSQSGHAQCGIRN